MGSRPACHIFISSLISLVEMVWREINNSTDNKCNHVAKVSNEQICLMTGMNMKRNIGQLTLNIIVLSILRLQQDEN